MQHKIEKDIWTNVIDIIMLDIKTQIVNYGGSGFRFVWKHPSWRANQEELTCAFSEEYEEMPYLPQSLRWKRVGLSYEKNLQQARNSLAAVQDALPSGISASLSIHVYDGRTIEPSDGSVSNVNRISKNPIHKLIYRQPMRVRRHVTCVFEITVSHEYSRTFFSTINSGSVIHDFDADGHFLMRAKEFKTHIESKRPEILQHYSDLLAHQHHWRLDAKGVSYYRGEGTTVVHSFFEQGLQNLGDISTVYGLAWGVAEVCSKAKKDMLYILKLQDGQVHCYEHLVCKRSNLPKQDLETW